MAQIVIIVKPAQTRLRIAVKIILAVMILAGLLAAYWLAWDHDPNTTRNSMSGQDVVACGIVPQALTDRASEDCRAKGEGLASLYGSRLACGR